MSRVDSPRTVERQDLVVKPLKAALALANDLRLKTTVAITRRVDPHPAVLGHQRLRRRPVARVPHATGRLLVGLIAQMVGQLDLHRPLHQALCQLREQAPGPGDLLLGPSASQQLIDHLIADSVAIRPIHH